MHTALRVVMVGCGDIGSRVALILQQKGYVVHGLRRNSSKLPAAIVPIVADLNDPKCPADWPQQAIDYVV